MYEMLANEEADLALTLWPAKFWNSDRSEALTKSCHESSTDLCVATVGNQGYRARSGWFVSMAEVAPIDAVVPQLPVPLRLREDHRHIAEQGLRPGEVGRRSFRVDHRVRRLGRVITGEGG